MANSLSTMLGIVLPLCIDTAMAWHGMASIILLKYTRNKSKSNIEDQDEQEDLHSIKILILTEFSIRADFFCPFLLSYYFISTLKRLL